MPDLSFKILGVEPANRGLVPLLHFKLGIENQPPNETIQSVILQTQIQIAAPQRVYAEAEKEKLLELFGTPDQWGQTLRNRLWTHANTIVPTFSGTTEALLSVPCSYDLNVAATKYFHALADGEVPLLFLFSGTVFYAGEDGRLQVQQINWNCESTFRLPIVRWQELMNFHYPNRTWLLLEHETFERLYEFKRRAGTTSWEQAIDKLLAGQTPR
ncbi:MAG: DUF6084 family protein [Chthoniobacterales bacterium]